MATSLESQLIRGAGQAAMYDPRGMVAEAQARAFEQTAEGVRGVAKAFAGKKKEQEDIVKGYDTEWESIEKQYLDDGGLPIEDWKKATKLAKKTKTKHDACLIGQEGNMCRREAIMELKGMAGEWSGANDTLGSIVDTSAKIKNGDLKQSNYDSQSLDGRGRKAIRAGLNTGNSTSREKDGKLEVGWDIPGYGFISRNDDRLSNLHTFTADEVSLHILDRKKDQESDDWEDWDMANSIYANKSAITPKNIASIYHDEVTGPGGILKDNLKEHPMLKGASYKDLGIDRVGGDDVIDDDEIEAVIQALSDPKHPNFNFKISQAVAAEYMAMNENIEREKYLQREGLMEGAADNL
jgi:hypothetical protein